MKYVNAIRVQENTDKPTTVYMRRNSLGDL